MGREKGSVEEKLTERKNCTPLNGDQARMMNNEGGLYENLVVQSTEG